MTDTPKPVPARIVGIGIRTQTGAETELTVRVSRADTEDLLRLLIVEPVEVLITPDGAAAERRRLADVIQF